MIREAVERGSTYQAFHDFALIRRLFNWAIGTDEYGLELNPCDRLNTKDMIGERYARDRVLSDDELRALWRATDRLPYPNGPFYRLLTLTGLRLGEACGARWSEFDLERREWTIPAARMKKVKGGAKPFVVPLTDAMIDVLNSLPRFTSGECLFSHSYGKQPLRPSLFSDIKERLDRIMLEELRQLAIERGNDPERVALPDFVNHDIRRSVRTHLSALQDRRGSPRGCARACASGHQGRVRQAPIFGRKARGLDTLERAAALDCRTAAGKRGGACQGEALTRWRHGRS